MVRCVHLSLVKKIEQTTMALSLVDNSTNFDCQLCSLELQLFSCGGSFARWESTFEQVLLADLTNAWLRACTFA